MPTFEEAVLALLARAVALLFVAIVIGAIFLRRRIAGAIRDVRRDAAMLRFAIDDPVALTLLTIVAALLRMTYLSRPMGADESATFLYYASKPLLLGISVYGSPNNHLLHTALMHMSASVFGEAEWALRLPAFIAGVAMVPLTYLCASRLGNAPSVAAAAVAAWPALIDYSTDGRGYTMLCCFVLVCAAAMFEVRNGNRAACAIFIVSAALGMFTIPVMVYPFLMLLAWCGRRRETLVCAIGTILGALVLYFPALVVSGIGAITSNGYVRPMPLGSFVHDLPRYAMSAWSAMFSSVPVLLQILLGIAFIAGVFRQRMFWPGFLAVVLLIAVQRVLPFPRVWLPFLPLFLITAARGLKPAPDRLVALFLLIALATAAFTPRLRETGELRAAREITRELRLRAHPGDPVIALPPSEMPLAFYARRARVPLSIAFPDVRRPRVFAVENRDYGQDIHAIVAAFHVDPAYKIRRVRDFGSSVLYELTKQDMNQLQ